MPKSRAILASVTALETAEAERMKIHRHPHANYHDRELLKMMMGARND
jgi:hypothetical protein